MRKTLGYDLAKLSDQQIEEQFESVVKQIKELDSTKYQLNVANKMVVQKGIDILQTYRNDLAKYFQSSIKSVDFAKDGQRVKEEINQWVSRETHNKIRELLSEPLNPSTALVLLNAIYFNGKFQTMFQKNETREQTFFSVEGRQSSAQMMHRKGKFNHNNVPQLDSQLLEIPYSGNDISLYILLPNEIQGIKKLKTDLKNFTVLENSIEGLREKTVDVTFPKFKIETESSLIEKLSQLGMKSAFSGEADLSGIDGKRDLTVSDVKHKAYIEVSEEGTEAAAVTAVVSMRTSIVDPSQQVKFRADHPFMLFIINNYNGIVLFSGIINKV